MRRRRGIIRAVGFILSLFLVAPVFAQVKLERMHVGYSAQAGAFAPIWITKEAGFFKKNGLDVDLVFIPGGPTAAAALMAGEMQVVAMAGPAIGYNHPSPSSA